MTSRIRAVVALAVAVAAVFVVASALASGVAAEGESNFNVTIETDEAVDANGDLSVHVNVTNYGGVVDEQDIVLTDGDENEQDSVAVTLEPGESETRTLTWEGVPDDERTITPTVHSDDDADSTVVTVRWSYFTVPEIDPAETTIVEGESFDVVATVRNIGTVDDEQHVRLLVDGTEYGVERDVEIESEGSRTVRYTDVEPDLDPGTYSYTVATANGSASGSLTVLERATFVIDSIEGTYEDETAIVDTVVRNDGDVDGTQPVVFEVDGERIETRDVTLSTGQQTELTVTHEPDDVPINVTALTDVDAASVRVGVANIEHGPHIFGVTPDEIRPDESVTVTYTAAGENLERAELLVTGPDGSIVLDEPVSPGIETEHAIEHADLAAYREGHYDVTLRVEDEFGRADTRTLEDAFVASSTIEVGPRIEHVEPEFVQVDDRISIEYSAAGTNVASVHLLLEGPGGDVVFDRTVPQGENERQEIDPRDIADLEEGAYDVTVEIRDLFGNAESTTLEEAFEVAPVYDPDDANFGTTVSSTDDVVATYRAVAGDFVVVDVSLNDIDEAYVVVGGDRSTSSVEPRMPLDILHVDGSSTFVINTRFVGTDRPSHDVYIGEGVTSYAHTLGAGAEPAGVFADLRFEDEEYEPIADSLAEFRAELNRGEQIRPLQPGGYSLVIADGNSIVATDDGFADARFPLDRASIELTEPELGAVRTYAVPTGNADELEFDPDGDIEELTPANFLSVLDMATETSTIARDDRLLVEVEATGMYGALQDSITAEWVIDDEETALVHPQEFAELLERPEGVEVTMKHTNPGPNEERTQIDLMGADSEDVVFSPWAGLGRFYVLVDTREPGPFEPHLEDGEEYEISMSYHSPAGTQYRYPSTGLDTLPAPFDPLDVPHPSGIYPYFGADETTETRTASVTVEERFVEYDRKTVDGEPVVTNSADATISGTTNLAPGTDLPVSIVVDVRDDPTTVEIEGIDIEEDGRFSVEVDLSMLDPDEEVDIEFRAYQERLDERELVVFEEGSETSIFQVTNLAAQSVVTPEETFVELSATVTNTGLLEGNKTVELLLGEDVVANESVELEAGESRTFTFDDALADLEPGEYPLQIRTPDDRDGQILIVDDTVSVFEVETLSAESTVDADGPQVDLSTTIVNTGTINGTGSIEVLVDGEVLTERSPHLLVGQDITYTFADALADLEPGEYDLTVRTPDDEESIELIVEEPYSSFELVDVDVPRTIERGEELVVSTTVNNTGTISDTGEVGLDLESEILDQPVIELGAGENTTVAFAETTVERDPGEYVVTVRTADDERTFTLVVKEPSQQDDPGSGSGFLGLGIRSRAVVGGTAIVAAAHVFGHWI